MNIMSPAYAGIRRDQLETLRDKHAALSDFYKTVLRYIDVLERDRRFTIQYPTTGTILGTALETRIVVGHIHLGNAYYNRGYVDMLLRKDGALTHLVEHGREADNYTAEIVPLLLDVGQINLMTASVHRIAKS